MSATFTVRELIHFAEQQFDKADLYYGHGTDNAADEAFYLVMTVAGLEFDCDEEKLDEPLSENTVARIKDLINKRIEQRIPVAYLVNQAWFAGHKCYVDERVLIPRSPIAELINFEFTPWIKPEEVERILDIGTGCACIPIACAHVFPNAQIDAVDIDDDALDVAKLNISEHNLTDRVHLYKSDLFKQLDSQKYDIIISNPPYVSSQEMQTLPEEYRHEPGHALEADDNGLALVDKILKQSSDHLNDDGILIVEVGNSMDALIERHPELPFIWLDFENGGEGIFLLHKSDLESHQF